MGQQNQYASETKAASASSMVVMGQEEVLLCSAGTCDTGAPSVLRMSCSKPSHQRCIRASPLILAIPGCPECSSCKNLFLLGGGTTTRVPQEHSHLLLTIPIYDSSDGSMVFGHPCWTNCNTCESCGSLLVHVLISCVLTGASSRCSTSNTTSAGTGGSLGVSGCITVRGGGFEGYLVAV